jgi:hypothetical protein
VASCAGSEAYIFCVVQIVCTVGSISGRRRVAKKMMRKVVKPNAYAEAKMAFSESDVLD